MRAFQRPSLEMRWRKRLELSCGESQSFLPKAKAEYLDAIRFYESQRAGLGEDLIVEFERAIALASEHPEAWRLAHPSGRRDVFEKKVGNN